MAYDEAETTVDREMTQVERALNELCSSQTRLQEQVGTLAYRLEAVLTVPYGGAVPGKTEPALKGSEQSKTVREINYRTNQVNEISDTVLFLLSNLEA